jgi:aminoglycoside phosphotransferase (APT) family kinase protein
VPADVALADPESLGSWLDAQGLAPGEPLSVAPLAGGTSNAMYLVDRAEHRWVLRRPSKVALERSNEGMRREYRLLAGLEGTGVPHPAVVALCDDHQVLGCTFYLMERVEGITPLPLPAVLDDEAHRAEVAYAMVDALAELHQVDWEALGLGDLGHPEHFHERQVDRWTRQLASYGGRPLPGIDAVTAWLEAHLPPSFEPTLMHGDFHMLNALIAPDPPGRVVAVLDWETATIGDPLLDLAGFCEVWVPATGEGWPTAGQLVERYRATRGLEDVGDLTYYRVLYNFRLAVLLEGIFQRSLEDPTRTQHHDIGGHALVVLGRAVDLVAGPGAGR